MLFRQNNLPNKCAECSAEQYSAIILIIQWSQNILSLHIILQNIKLTILLHWPIGSSIS